jgi:hypothetical protein
MKTMDDLWAAAHRTYPGLGDYCKICDRETTSHRPDCPVWLSTKGTHGHP